VTRGKPIAVLLQSISGISAINPLVTFYDIDFYDMEERLPNINTILENL
jgi:hypothetical protein